MTDGRYKYLYINDVNKKWAMRQYGTLPLPSNNPNQSCRFYIY